MKKNLPLIVLGLCLVYWGVLAAVNVMAGTATLQMKNGKLTAKNGKIVGVSGAVTTTTTTTTTTTIPDMNMVQNGDVTTTNNWEGSTLTVVTGNPGYITGGEIYQGIGGKGNGVITNGATYLIVFNWLLPANPGYPDYSFTWDFGAGFVGSYKETISGYDGGELSGVVSNTGVWTIASDFPPWEGTNLVFSGNDYGQYYQRAVRFWNIKLYYVSGP